jgi:hypothetical protein
MVGDWGLDTPLRPGLLLLGPESCSLESVVRRPDGHVIDLSLGPMAHGLGISILKPDGDVLDLSLCHVLDGGLVHRTRLGYAEEFRGLVDVRYVHVIPGSAWSGNRG